MITFILASDFRDFLDLEAAYIEPQMTKGHVRVMVYIGHNLTIYAGNPFAVCVTDNRKVPRPMLDGSM